MTRWDCWGFLSTNDKFSGPFLHFQGEQIKEMGNYSSSASSLSPSPISLSISSLPLSLPLPYLSLFFLPPLYLSLSSLPLSLSLSLIFSPLFPSFFFHKITKCMLPGNDFSNAITLTSSFFFSPFSFRLSFRRKCIFNVYNVYLMYTFIQCTYLLFSPLSNAASPCKW